MKMKHQGLLIISLVLIIPANQYYIILPQVNHSMNEKWQEGQNTQKLLSSSISEIVINGNLQLSSFASSGNGTQANPLIIENYIWTSSYKTGTALTIINTTYFFIIQNLVIQEYNYAINLTNVQNGIIRNNNISVCHEAAFLNQSSIITLENNNLYEIIGDSFEIVDSSQILMINNVIDKSSGALSIIDTSSITVLDNKLTNLLGESISLISATKTLIANNTFSNCYGGIFLLDSYNNTIDLNKFYNGGRQFIWMYNSNNNSFLNNELLNGNSEGFYLLNSNGTILLNNRIIHNNKGIFIEKSDNSLLLNNSISFSPGYGIQLLASNNNRLENNTSDKNNLEGLIIDNSHSNVITNNSFGYNTHNGVILTNTMKTTFENNRISNNQKDGILAINSNSDTIFNNSMCSNWQTGSKFFLTNNDNILNNFIQNNTVGMHLEYSTANDIENNAFYANTITGLVLNSSNKNIITTNKAIGNYDYGFALSNSFYNIIYLNFFVSNNLYYPDRKSQASSIESSNDWTNGTIGNYWNDYKGIDENNDNIGDSYYEIDGFTNELDTKPIIDPYYYIQEGLNSTIPKIDRTLPIEEKSLGNIFEISIILTGGLVSIVLMGLLYMYTENKKFRKLQIQDKNTFSFPTYLLQKFRRRLTVKKRSTSLSESTIQDLEEIITENTIKR
jgi:parallel beta-helix repeat protein